MKYTLLYIGKRCLQVCGMLLILLCTAVDAKAQVSVQATMDSLQLLIGEQTKIKLQVSMDANQKLQLPVLQERDTLVAGVEVLEIAKPDTQLLNDNKRWLVSQEYTITSFDSALYYLPPFQVLVNDKPYQSDPLALMVYSIPVDTLHPDQFFGPKDVEDVSLTWDDLKSLVFASLFALILAGLAIFFIIRYHDNKPIIRIIRIEPKLPPHQAAMKKIEAIKAEKASQKGDPKAYYTELTEAIRTYIKDRFGFNAMEMTSSEIIERLLQEKDKDSIRDLKNLFETADLVKFAKYAPLMNVNDMNLVNAIEFINQTKIEEDQNAKKEPTEIKVEEKRSKRGRIMLMCSIAAASIGAIVSLYFVVRNILDLFF